MPWNREWRAITAAGIYYSQAKGVRGRVPRKHRDNRDAGVRGHEARATQHRVVEMRRDDNNAVELARLRQPPAAHRKGIVTDTLRLGHESRMLRW